MCGIFGLARANTDHQNDLAVEVFSRLGHLSMERGTDSSGFAVTAADPQSADHFPATGATTAARNATLGQTVIAKDCLPFDKFWDHNSYAPLVAEATVAIGHTRAATQGNKADLRNASPLAVGTLVGTHNGDVTLSTIKGERSLPLRHGGTDTERLYQAIHRDRLDRRKVKDVLTTVEGRVALAWIDRAMPGRLYLARAALSPLSIAFDRAGNLWWASNPNWFRIIDKDMGGAVGFTGITMVTEGTMLTVDVTGDVPVVTNRHVFTPVSRARDERIADAFVWRYFTPEDEKADKAQRVRTVAPEPVNTSRGGWGKSAAASASVFSGRQSWLDKYSASADAWWGDDPEDAYEPEVWDEDLDDALLLAEGATDLDREDGEVALIEWMETGENPEVVRRLREETSPKDRARMVADFGLRSENALYVFAAEVFGYLAEQAEEAAHFGESDEDEEAEVGEETVQAPPALGDVVTAATAAAVLRKPQRASTHQIGAALTAVTGATQRSTEGFLVFGRDIGVPVGNVYTLSDDALIGVMALVDEVEAITPTSDVKASNRVRKVIERLQEEYARRGDLGGRVAEDDLAGAC